MIDFQTFSQVRQLAGEQLSVPQIAAALKLNPKTVRKWLAEERYRKRHGRTRASRLDPFKPTVQRLLERHPYTAVQVLRLIRDEGYTGGQTILKDYVRRVRPVRRTVYLTLSFAPGECAQIDWGSAGVVQLDSVRRRLSFFVMVLCYSRMLWLWFSFRQGMEHFLWAQRCAFEHFGGVPARIMVDNCKTAVLAHPQGGPATINPRYEDFARHYGFTIAPCNVRAAHEKGRVENAVGYVKKSLLNGLDLAGLAAVQAAGDAWRDQVANVRTHGQTGKRPVDLFPAEKAQLQPLPLNPYDCSVSGPASSDAQFRVRFDANRYSVPAQYGSRKNGLVLRADPQRLLVYADGQLVAEHLRRYGSGGDYEHPDHPKPLLETRRRARDQHLLRHFLALGSVAEAYYHGLCERRLNGMHHVRQIMALAEVHGPEAVTAAMTDAAHFHAFSADCVLNLLAHRTRHQEPPSPLHLTRNQDLLELSIQPPDLSVYSPPEDQEDPK